MPAPDGFPYSPDVQSSAAQRWPVWLRRFEQYTLASGIEDDRQKTALLLYLVGEEAADVYVAEQGDGYKEVRSKLESHFAPLRNYDVEHLRLMRLKRKPGESLDDYANVIRKQALLCGFTSEVQVQAEVRKVFVCLSDVNRTIWLVQRRRLSKNC